MSWEWAHPALLLLLLGLLVFETGHTGVAGRTGHTVDAFRWVLAVEQHFFNTEEEKKKREFELLKYGGFRGSHEPTLKTSGLFLTFRCDVWTTQSPLNDFLGLSIFGLQNVDGVLQLSEFRVLTRVGKKGMTCRRETEPWWFWSGDYGTQ